MNDKLKTEELIIARNIYEIRGKQVMLSGDLAVLYEVETRVLNQKVKRNMNRFPERYMFKLTQEEYRNTLRSQNVILEKGKYSKYPPYAFTEHGVLMLSSILRSARAEKINLVIIDTFVKLRSLVSKHHDLLLKIEEIERSLSSHDRQILILFENFKKLLHEKRNRDDILNRKRIGFKK